MFHFTVITILRIIMFFHVLTYIHIIDIIYNSYLIESLENICIDCKLFLKFTCIYLTMS